MAAGALGQKPVTWTSELIRMLRGKRSQVVFGRMLGVPKNTVWRWEAGRSSPDNQHVRRLSRLAEREGFLAGWKLAGSMTLVGDLEEGSREIARQFQKSLDRTARQLAGQS